MNKSKTLLAVVIAIMLGGCGQMGSSPEEEPEKTPAEMDPADLPQIDAFQSEHSREMMVSTEPVADGYYLMRSKIGAFTIWFPEEAVFMYNASGVDGDHYEKLRFAYESEEENWGYIADFEYFYSGSANRPENKLERLRRRWDFEGEWKELKDGKTTLYYGVKENETEYGLEVVIIGFKVYESGVPQATEFSYIASCVDNNLDTCQVHLDEEEAFVRTWVESIEYTQREEHDG
ncbi:MAG: Lipoprotein [Shouchella clausii]|jgi:hypothetical protein